MLWCSECQCSGSMTWVYCLQYLKVTVTRGTELIIVITYLSVFCDFPYIYIYLICCYILLELATWMIEVLHSYFFVVLPCGDRTVGTVSTVLYVLYECPSKTATVTWVACCTNRGDLWYNRPVWCWPQCCCYSLAAPGHSSSTVHTGGRGWHIDRNREKDRGIYCCCQLISAVSDASVIIASLKVVGEKMWEAVSWMKAQLDPERKKKKNNIKLSNGECDALPYNRENKALIVV